MTLAQGLTLHGRLEPAHEPAITLQGEGAGTRRDPARRGRVAHPQRLQHGAAVIRNLTFEQRDARLGAGGAIYAPAPPRSRSPTRPSRTTAPAMPAAPSRIDDQIPRSARTAGRTAQGSEAAKVTITGNTFGGAGDGDADQSGSNGGALAVYVSGPVTLADNASAATRHRLRRRRGRTFCGTATVADNTFEDNVVEAASSKAGEADGVFGGTALGGGLLDRGLQLLESRSTLGTLEAAPGRTRSSSPATCSAPERLETGIEDNGRGAGECQRASTLDSTDDTYHANRMRPGIGPGGGLRCEAAAAPCCATSSPRRTRCAAGAAAASRSPARDARSRSSTGRSRATRSARARAPRSTATRAALTVDNSIVHGNTGGPEISGFDELPV